MICTPIEFMIWTFHCNLTILLLLPGYLFQSWHDHKDFHFHRPLCRFSLQDFCFCLIKGISITSSLLPHISWSPGHEHDIQKHNRGPRAYNKITHFWSLTSRDTLQHLVTIWMDYLGIWFPFNIGLDLIPHKSLQRSGDNKCHTTSTVFNSLNARQNTFLSFL